MIWLYTQLSGYLGICKPLLFLYLQASLLFALGHYTVVLTDQIGIWARVGLFGYRLDFRQKDSGLA